MIATINTVNQKGAKVAKIATIQIENKNKLNQFPKNHSNSSKYLFLKATYLAESSSQVKLADWKFKKSKQCQSTSKLRKEKFYGIQKR